MPIEFFPKEPSKQIRLDEAYVYWFLFGSLGVHHFYMGNKRRGCYLLATSGVSHILFIIYATFKHQILHYIDIAAINYIFIGYFLALPLLVWDLFTLPFQVIKKKGNITTF